MADTDLDKVFASTKAQLQKSVKSRLFAYYKRKVALDVATEARKLMDKFPCKAYLPPNHRVSIDLSQVKSTPAQATYVRAIAAFRKAQALAVELEASHALGEKPLDFVAAINAAAEDILPVLSTPDLDPSVKALIGSLIGSEDAVSSAAGSSSAPFPPQSVVASVMANRLVRRWVQEVLVVEQLTAAKVYRETVNKKVEELRNVEERVSRLSGPGGDPFLSFQAAIDAARIDVDDAEPPALSLLRRMDSLKPSAASNKPNKAKKDGRPRNPDGVSAPVSSAAAAAVISKPHVPRAPAPEAGGRGRGGRGRGDGGRDGGGRRRARSDKGGRHNRLPSAPPPGQNRLSATGGRGANSGGGRGAQGPRGTSAASSDGPAHKRPRKMG